MARTQRHVAREDAFAREGDFNEQLYQAIRKSPWWMISIAGHVLLFLIMSSFTTAPEAAVVHKPILAAAAPPAEEVPQEAPPLDDPIEPMQSDEVLLREPDLVEAQIDEVKSSDADMPFDDQVSGEVEGDAEGSLEGPQSNADLGTAGGAGGGKGWGSMRSRSRGRSTGTTARKDDAALHALRWLAAHQSDDGGWEAAGFDRWCDGKANTGEKPDGPGKAMYDAGVTGLALCAFLGAGYTNRGDHEFAKTVRKGLAYLKNVQDPEGCFGPRSTQHYIYNHATAALAMVEAYGMTESPIFKGSAQKALDFLALTRNPYYVWRYGVKPGDNDTSVTGWMMMALKSAQLINADAKKRGKSALLVIDEDCFEGIKSWLDKMTDPDDGRVGYISRGQGPARPQELVDRFPGEKSESMTAVGMLARIFMHEDPQKSDIVKKGAELCLKVPPTWNKTDGSIDMYYWYYATLAMFQVGGSAWDKWEKAMDTSMVANQRMDGTYCGFKGSWDPLDPWGADGGRVYSTAVLCMCMEVKDRYMKMFVPK
jgi:hypothetical protein